MKPACPSTAASVAVALLCMASWAQAQYKVVQPDGSISYTDRPPITTNARITNLGRPGSGVTPAEIGLPPDLRAAAQRYPVVLYTSGECGPCDTGRRLLQQRGVPYNERRVSTEEDAVALERLVGGRTVPAITIGAQPLRGFSEADWGSYLDVAGYPRENKLPRGWQVPEPTPVVERATPAPRAAAPEPRPAPAPTPAPAPAPGTTIRF